MKSAMLTNTSTRQSVLIAAAFASSVLGLAQPAHALDFSFSFRGVEGYLTGLVDNSTDQIPLTVVVANTVNGAGVFPYYFGISSQALMDLALLTATLLLPIRGCCFDPFHQVSILILQALMVAKAALITGTVTIFGLATLGLALAVRPTITVSLLFRMLEDKVRRMAAMV